MPQLKSKIDVAIEQSAAIHSLMYEASKCLEINFLTDGYGIIRDVTFLRGQVGTAILRLNAAALLLSQFERPSDDDYENDSNRHVED